MQTKNAAARARPRCQIHSFLLWVWCVSRAVLAGPPLEFDDPDTPGSGHWEINLASTLEHRANLSELKPVLDLNYGWGERVQLKLKPRLVVLDSPGERARAGVGNIQFGVKWRFFDEAKHGVGMSLYPQADINPPARSIKRDFVDDGHDLFLPFQIARAFGRVRLYADGGHNWRGGREDEWIVSFAAEYRLVNQFLVMSELRDIAQREFQRHELFCNAGFKWKLREHWTLLASAGARCTNGVENAPPCFRISDSNLRSDHEKAYHPRKGARVARPRVPRRHFAILAGGPPALI